MQTQRESDAVLGRTAIGKTQTGRLQLVIALIIVWLGVFLVNNISADGEGDMRSVMRNWEQYGIAAFKYQFVINPGGISHGERPEFYMGHRPLCLLPAYYVGHFFGGAGESALPVLLMLSMTTTCAVLFFLRRNNLALATGLLIPLCYGYLSQVRTYDPIAATILLGIPMMAASVMLICTERIKGVILGVILMLVYSQLNWPSIFPLAVASVYLMIRLKNRPQIVCVVLAAALVGVIAVGYSTVSARLEYNNTVAGMPQPHDYLWQSYLWGEKGYDGNGMTLGKMLLRNIITNTVNLLPIVLLLGYICLFKGIKCMRVLLSLAPLVVSVIGILGMRNLFGHHPWMSGPPILCGCLFSISLLQGQGKLFDLSKRQALLWIAAGIGYCFLMVLVRDASNFGPTRLGALVDKNTKRDCLIVFMPDIDASVYNSTKRWSATFDRKVVSYSDWKSEGSPFHNRTPAVLLGTKMDGVGRFEIAHTSEPRNIEQLVMQVFRFYRTRISKRAPMDCLEVEQIYYLYNAN